MQKEDINLVWFRNDLRVRDNKSLSEACLLNNMKTLAFYCFDPRYFAKTKYGFKKTEKFRAKFLIESVQNLKDNLEKLNITLVVFHEKPEDAIDNLNDKFKIKNIFFQNEWTSEEKCVEENLLKKLKECEINSYDNQFLFSPDQIPYENYADLPEVFTQFRKACEKKIKINLETPIPTDQTDANLIDFESEVPRLKDLGFEDFEVDNRSVFPFKGGEDSAWDRLNDYFWKTKKLQVYKKTRNGLLGTDYSSKFSAWLANGSISTVSIYHQVKLFEKEVTKNQDTYWLIFELIWRDFFKYMSLKHRNAFFKLDGINTEKYDWHFNPKIFQKWVDGKTEEDFVNANMLEIKETGFMSNRGRQNVCSYWSKELLQDWRAGAAYFEAMLIDYDVHSNWGNWMYNSGVGNDPRNRKFNIKSQAQRYDGQGKYQRQWLQNNLF